MKNDYNSQTEGNVLKYLSSSIGYVKGKTSVELEMFKQSKSVINDSVAKVQGDEIQSQTPNVFANTDISYSNPVSGQNFEQTGSDFGQEQTKNKQLVRTMNGPHGQVSHPLVNQNNISNNDSNYYSGYSSDYAQQNSMNGSVSTLILVGTAVLVVLIVLVSLIVMNYIRY